MYCSDETISYSLFSVFYTSRLCRGISPEFLVHVLLFVIQLE